MAFNRFKSPVLPLPPKEYNFAYFNQLVRSLNTFFTVGDAGAGVHHSNVSTTQLKFPVGALVLTAGNNDNIQPLANTFLRITAPGNFAVRGINSTPQNENDGRVIILLNASGYTMTIYNNQASVSAKNRIDTGGGAASISASRAVLIYSVTDSRWQLVAHEN
jgi:hypothetical protein